MANPKPNVKSDIPVKSFPTQLAWETWLEAQPENAKGLWLKLARKSSGIPTVSRDDAVDTALCHGWIDGQAVDPAPRGDATLVVRTGDPAVQRIVHTPPGVRLQTSAVAQFDGSRLQQAYVAAGARLR